MAKIIIAGATGLVGNLVAHKLALTDVDLHLLTRRKLDAPIDSAKQHIGATDTWAGIIKDIRPDIAISCLGTTMRLAGSKSAFAAIDHDLVLNFANAAFTAGARRMISVSSVGASPTSSNFYLATKGKADRALEQVGFDRLDIIRPGLLRGERGGERRVGEQLGIMLSPLADLIMQGGLRRYRSISASDVAQAISALTLVKQLGFHTHENEAIIKLSGIWQER
jgi:uncharacterized protein YbjT (DUF2867 family)